MIACKTRSQLALEYGVSRKSFYNWLKRRGIKISNGLVTPKEIEFIHNTFGLQRGNNKQGANNESAKMGKDG
jgi:hypothetical protein